MSDRSVVFLLEEVTRFPYRDRYLVVAESGIEDALKVMGRLERSEERGSVNVPGADAEQIAALRMGQAVMAFVRAGFTVRFERQ